MRLSYSKYKTYLQCPRLYYNQTFKVPSTIKNSEYFSLYGRLIEKFFQKQANIYTKASQPLTDDEIRDVLKKDWAYILSRSYVNWDDPWVNQSSNEIFESVVEDTHKNLKAFDFWAQCKSEVTYEVSLKKSQDTLSCRMDFIRETADGVEILDGKGTAKMDKNVDVEQLYFYALMYFLKHGKLPQKIGFLYYKYQILKYVDFDMDIITKFKQKLALVKKAIKVDKIFVSKPMLSKHCRWCVWRDTCSGYKAKQDKIASRKKDKMGIVPTGTVVSLGI